MTSAAIRWCRGSIGIFAAALVMTSAAMPTSTYAADITLDYEFFKARVQPIFLTKRDNHVRCYVCHSEATNAFKLVHMEKGQTVYTEEDTRKNFETVSRLIMPGEPMKSMLLTRPLAPEHGGHPYHSGGRQFASRNTPEWKTLEQFAKGAKSAKLSAK